MEPSPIEDQLAALAARVDALERRLAEPVSPPAAVSRATVPPPPAPATPPSPAAPPPPPPPPAVPTPTAPASPPGWASTENLLKWSGVVLVALAAIFFVGNAISRGWIGPEVQLAGAALIGVALLAGGQRLADTRRPWAVALACGGAVVLPVCAAASTTELDLFDPYPALVLLAIAVVAILVYSTLLSMEAVATVALVTGQLAMLPIVDTADAPALVPGLWLVAAAVVAAGLGVWREWILCRVLSAGLAALLLIALLLDEGDGLVGAERGVAVAGVAVVAIIGWFGPVLSRAATITGWRSGLDHRTVLGVPLWTWGAVTIPLHFDNDPSLGRTAVVLAAGFLALAGGGHLRRWPSTLIAAQLAGAGTLAAVGLATLIEGPGLLVALTGLTVGSVILATLLRDVVLGCYALVVGVIVAIWTAVLVAGSWTEPRPWPEKAATALVIGLVVIAAVVALRRAQATATQPQAQSAHSPELADRAQPERPMPVTQFDDPISLLVVLAWVSVLAWVAGVVVHGPQGQMLVSLLWAMAAVGGLLLGVVAGQRLFRIIGLATMAVVLTKLLTIDLAEVDVLWRVGLFLVVGTGFLRLGYVLPRLAARYQPAPESNGPPASAP